MDINDYTGEGNTVPDIRDADRLIIYSLYDDFSGADMSTGPMFHRMKILGKVEVRDINVKEQLADSLDQAMAERGPELSCFVEYHGMRIIKKGKTIDAMISFTCDQMFFFYPVTGGASPGTLKAGPTILISSSARPVFDRVLKNAGQPVVHL